ncbi:MAG: UBP-type zinc finger domain-containing protein [Microbacterium sp.]
MNRRTDPAIDPGVPPSGTGCVECDEEHSWWVHLRRCAKCGHIGCCDDSLNQHATQHAAQTRHPVIRSFEPGEDWFWDYRTNDFVDGPQMAPPESHPESQTVPGPAERLPQNWETLLEQRRNVP